MRGCTSARQLALAVACAASIGGLYILLKEDVVAGRWSDAFVLVPVLMMIVVSAGHLAGKALRERHILAAIGFAVAFTLGTVLTIYTSMGKQASTVDAKFLEATASNKDRADASTELDQINRTLSFARPDKERECVGAPSPLPPRGWPECRRKTATVTALERRRDELKSEIKGAPPKPVASDAERIAQAVNMLFGADAGVVKDVVLLVQPFAFPLTFEWTAIVAFGFAFGGRKSPVQASVRSAETQSSPAAPHPRGGRRCDPLIQKWVADFERRNGRPPQIDEVQVRFPRISRTSAWRYSAKHHKAA